MPSDTQFAISCYYSRDDELKFIQDVLQKDPPAKVYQDVVDGWITDSGTIRLDQHGLRYEIPGRRAPMPTVPAAPAAGAAAETTPIRRSRHNDPRLVAILEAFEKTAQKVTVDRARGLRPGPAAWQEWLERFIPALKGAPLPAPESAPHPGVFSVFMRGGLSSEEAASLKQRFEVCSFHAPDIYRMILTPAQVDQVRALPFVMDIQPFGFADTVSQQLIEYFENVTGKKGIGAMLAGAVRSILSGLGVQDATFDVILHRPEDHAAIQALLAGTKVKILEENPTKFRIQAAGDLWFLAALAGRPEVESLSVYNPPKLYCEHARSLVGLATINPPGNEHWTGAGEVIAIFDSGVDKDHPDLTDRIKYLEYLPGATSVDKEGHGTHVAGIIAGTGAASGGKIRGVAPGAQLVCFGIVDKWNQLTLPIDLGDLLKRAIAQEAKIINLSWGAPIDGDYDHGSRDVDRFVFENPEVLVVVAAGNQGQAPQGTYKFRTVGTPATAKNVITVGASATDRPGYNQTWADFAPVAFRNPAGGERVSGTPDVPAGVSSRGPTDFDSVKPDLIAPGTYILSTRAATAPSSKFWNLPDGQLDDWRLFFENKYVYLGGTSMAAPFVSGAAAILRQYLQEQRETTHPSAALLKAMLLASVHRLPSNRDAAATQEIGYPDFDQGFGRVDLASIFPHPAAPPGRQILFVDISNSSPDGLESRLPVGAPRKSSRSYRVEVSPGAADPLRVVLAWTDPPGASLQNSLQLEVTDPSGAKYVGNAEHRYRRDPRFDPTNTDGIALDKRNSVQQISVAAPAMGTWTVRVFARNTTSPPQGYALCTCGQFASAALDAAG